MSDFTNEEPQENDGPEGYFEFDPGQEAAERAGKRDFSVAEAWYPATVSAFEKTKSKAQNDMFKISFVDHTGVTKTKYPYVLYQTISDNNKHIVAGLLDSLGFAKNDKGVFQVEPAKVVGTVVEIFLKPDTYNGVTRSKPSKVRKQQVDKGIF